MFVFAVRFQIVNEHPCVFPNPESAPISCTILWLFGGISTIHLETPLKKPLFASGLLFVKNYFATFDNEYYTLSDINYSGERRTSTRLFHVIFICSGFCFPVKFILSHSPSKVNMLLLYFFMKISRLFRFSIYSLVGSRYSSGIRGGKGVMLKIQRPKRGSRAIA